MNFIGVDLHKKSITVCVMDEKRKVLARKTLACTQTDEIVEFCRQFRPFKVVVEATASYLWFVELVEPLAEKVVLANPKKLRVIAESTKQTDRLDAQVLTEFLVLDMIPESYQPTPRHGSNAGHSSGVAQGQRSLNCCSGRDFQHEVFAPTATAAFPSQTVAAGMLLPQRPTRRVLSGATAKLLRDEAESMVPNIDPEQVRKLAGWGLTQNDRASFVGWSQSLLSLRF